MMLDRACCYIREQAAEQKVKEMAAVGIIKPSNRSWVAPVVLAKKKDNSWHFYLDYRWHNAVTKPHSHPVPHIDALEQLASSAWFCSV
ncbi:hypothetical protein P4O66_014304, partial [Electrophorus voltai]